MAVRFPQATYTGFTHCLQAEWQYLSRCVPAMGPLLAPIKEAIHDKLIPALLGGMPDQSSREDFRRLVAKRFLHQKWGLGCQPPGPPPAGASRSWILVQF